QSTSIQRFVPTGCSYAEVMTSLSTPLGRATTTAARPTPCLRAWRLLAVVSGTLWVLARQSGPQVFSAIPRGAREDGRFEYVPRKRGDPPIQRERPERKRYGTGPAVTQENKNLLAELRSTRPGSAEAKSIAADLLANPTQLNR
ncbi:unnamed protein product, partial [Polarella glacialis]